MVFSRRLSLSVGLRHRREELKQVNAIRATQDNQRVDGRRVLASFQTSNVGSAELVIGTSRPRGRLFRRDPR